ncbi:MAG: phosphatase PAP2 family protein [bacterium]|nr:phosphatase PAP2 family protein [bacterium]
MAARATVNGRPLALAAAALTAFAALGAAIDRWGPWGWDRGWQSGPALLALWRAVTHLGDVPAYLILCLALLLAGVTIARVRRAAIATVAGLPLLWRIGDLAKELFHRSRPPGWHGVIETSYSYPSGHAELSLFFYGAIALWVIGPYLSAPRRRGLFLFGGLVVCLLSASRVALGVHYLTDLLGGWLLATGWLAIVGTVARLWPVRRRAALSG